MKLSIVCALVMGFVSVSAWAKQECSVNGMSYAVPLDLNTDGVKVDVWLSAGARLITLKDMSSGISVFSTLGEDELQILSMNRADQEAVVVQCFDTKNETTETKTEQKSPCKQVLTPAGWKTVCQ